MPELPDVQVAKEYVDATSLHRRVTGSRIAAEHELVEGLTPQELGAVLAKRTLVGTRRHGKHLFIDLRGVGRRRWLRFHFGMTGTLEAWDGEGDGAPEYTRLRLDFDDGRHLAYRCPRRLGSIELVDDPDAWIETEGLGPDPWRRDDDTFLEECLEARRGQIKPTLMNQEVVAGLGNVYVDEILFQEGVHPTTSVPELRNATDGGEGETTLRSLHGTMQRVLSQATRDHRADPEAMPADWLLSDRSAGRSCPRCDGTVQKTRVGGRTTYFCPAHQPAP